MVHFTRLAAVLSASIDGVPFGGSIWRDIVAALAEAFPGAFAATHGEIRRQAHADAALDETVSRLCQGEETEVSSISFVTATGRWLFSLATICTGATTIAFGSLFPPRRMVLITATELSTKRSYGPDAQASWSLCFARHTVKS